MKATTPLTMALSLFVAAAVAAEQPSFALLDDECGGDFCLRATLTVEAGVRGDDEARMAFCQHASGAGYHVVLRGGRLRIAKSAGGKYGPLADWRDVRLPEEGACEVTVVRHGKEIRAIVGRRMVAFARDGSFTDGKAGTWVSSERLKWEKARLQLVEPVYLSDDFMRTAEHRGEWSTSSGRWKLEGIRGEPKPPPPEQTSNPFAYRGVALPGAPALATTGYWFWHDYSIAAAARPRTRDAFGLCAYHQDERNYLAFRWSSGLGDGAKQLVCVVDGKKTVLAEEPGGYEPDQWYWIELRVAGSEVAAFVDGEEACRARNLAFGKGHAGLLVAGRNATTLFDDVLVVSREAGEAPLPFPQDTGVPKHYVNDEIMRTWTTERWSWQEGEDDTYWHHGRFFAEPAVELPVTRALGEGEKLWCALVAEDQDTEAGYRLEITAREENAEWSFSRAGKQVASVEGPLPAKTSGFPVRLRETAGRFEASWGTNTVLEYEDPNPLRPRRVGIGATKGALDLGAANATCPLARDWMFSRAPMQFRLARGVWEIEPHWACEGKAAHFYGLDEHGASVLWTKDAFEGDLAMEAILSNADYQVRGGERIPKCLGVTVGGDGCNLATGYSFVLGAGEPRETLLIRGDEVLARSASKTLKKGEHNRDNWLRVRLELTGKKLRLLVEGEVECEHELKGPVPEGRLALWSYEGGIVLGRVRLWPEAVLPRPLASAAMVEVDRVARENPHEEFELSPPEAPLAGLSLDFEKDLGCLVTRDMADSAVVTLDDSTAASGRRSLKIVNPACGGNFATWPSVAPITVRKGARLEFDYRLPADGSVKLNFYVRRGGAWNEVIFTAGAKAGDNTPGSTIADVAADGQWHHGRFPLYDFLTKDDPAKPDTVTLDQIALASPNDFLLRCGFTGNPYGATWWLDNLRLGPSR